MERRFIELDRVATGISAEGPRGRFLEVLTAKLVLAGAKVLSELDQMDPVTWLVTLTRGVGQRNWYRASPSG